jgi:hypothetical protein
MPLPDINLDDRTFTQIFQELRRRIPAYAPEWTDHNDSDPGITLMQMFSWLAEIVIYRLNRVPEKSYIKFLELMGIELHQPAAARTELQFTLVKGEKPSHVGAGSQVQLGAAGDGPPVIFETDADLTVVSTQLKSVQSYDGSQFTDCTAANAVDGPPGFYPLSDIPHANSGLYLGLDTPFPAGDPKPQHRITFHIAQDNSPTTVTGGSDQLSLVSPPVDAYWEYWSQQQQWRQLQVVRDTTFALTKNGYITFIAPSDPEKRKIGLLTKPGDDPLFWIRFHVTNLLGAGYEKPPRLEGILLNTVSATNSVQEKEELVGASNGRPNQVFNLANFPVLPLDPGQKGIIAVDEDDNTGFQVWTEVPDFAGSKPDDKHYTLNHGTGEIRFGDGKRGKIPRWRSGNGTNRDEADQPNIKATSYRWGGGVRGNAGANTITTLLESKPAIQSVTNPHPSFGGEDEETVEEASSRAPSTLRNRGRAVTIEDFAEIAKQTPGAQIKRAQAFPLLNPNFRLVRSTSGDSPSTCTCSNASSSRQSGTRGKCDCKSMKESQGPAMPQPEVPIPGAITVIVVPDGTAPNPIPTRGTLQLVANYLDQHRLLTTELFVAAPRYREIHIEAHVIASPTADLGNVEQGVRDQLQKYFHPLTGGEQAAGWEFGEEIDFSETYRQIFQVDGVERIDTDSVTIYLDQIAQPKCSNVALQPDELVFSREHAITASYS